MEDCSYVQKTGFNKFHQYKFATAADVLAKVNEALVRYGVVAIPKPKIVSTEHVTTKNGGNERLITVETEITLHDCDLAANDGATHETLVITGFGSGQDVGDKAVMKAQTAAAKYAWMISLCIATGDDPEFDESVDQRNAEGPPANNGQQHASGQRGPSQSAPLRPSIEAFRAAAQLVRDINAAAALWIAQRASLGADDRGPAWSILLERCRVVSSEPPTKVQDILKRAVDDLQKTPNTVTPAGAAPAPTPADAAAAVLEERLKYAENVGQLDEAVEAIKSAFAAEHITGSHSTALMAKADHVRRMFAQVKPR
jgi:hypothetical protein